jgi:microcystin-dependent protein
MTQPFLGQIQPYAFNFAPKYWAQCNGQLLPIAQYSALFSLLGTYYGGNGVQNFALPDLRGRVGNHMGTLAGEAFVIGEVGGQENVTLNSSQMPQHNHMFMGSSANATVTAPAAGGALAKATAGSGTPDDFYGAMSPPQTLNPATIMPAGTNQPHNNLQPYLTVNWCIAMSGIYPSRN